MLVRKEKPEQFAVSRLRHPRAARAGSLQETLQEVADGSPQVRQFLAFQAMADSTAAQRVPSVAVIQRRISNRMRNNMQRSLARVFGGPAGRYVIDQNSGRTFPDGPPHYTTGHHGVAVTDNGTRRPSHYSCDFHQDGNYYTRG